MSFQGVGEFGGEIEKVWERVLGIEFKTLFSPKNPRIQYPCLFFTMVHSTQGLGKGGGGSWRRLANNPAFEDSM
jgi:hypothetical protein